jgi:cell division protein FtsI/penicillin-binding protein 2
VGKTGVGKTGVGKTGVGRADHVWFAGFVPADEPLVVIVVALEHCGSGGTAAAPVAKRLVMRMRELGLF